MGNAHRSFIGDMMIVRAAQDMKAGTELLMPYHDPARYYGTEMKNALKHWGFECTCAICKDFETTDANVLEERDALFKKLAQSCSTDNWSQDQLDQFEAALQNCEATYTHPETEVPRIRLADLQALFAIACAANGMLEKSLEWVVKAMQSLGFIFEGADRSDVPFSIVRWGRPTVTLVKKMLLHLKSVFGHLDLEKKAKQVESYARTAYKILVGEDDTFNETFARP